MKPILFVIFIIGAVCAGQISEIKEKRLASEIQKYIDDPKNAEDIKALFKNTKNGEEKKIAKTSVISAFTAMYKFFKVVGAAAATYEVVKPIFSEIGQKMDRFFDDKDNVLNFMAFTATMMNKLGMVQDKPVFKKEKRAIGENTDSLFDDKVNVLDFVSFISTMMNKLGMVQDKPVSKSEKSMTGEKKDSLFDKDNVLSSISLLATVMNKLGMVQDKPVSTSEKPMMGADKIVKYVQTRR